MSESEQLNRTLAAAIRRLMRPLVRLLLRHGVAFDTFADWARRVYVDVAFDEFDLPGKRQTISRVSVLTGLTRKEVSRLRAEGDGEDKAVSARYNRSVRVISGWLNDPAYIDGTGCPSVLPLHADGHSFADLVRRHSGDMPFQAVLDELVRSGVVRVEGDDVRLIKHAYVPSDSELGKLQILGTDVGYLIGTIDHNLAPGAAPLFFQRKVMSEMVAPETVWAFRELAGRDAQALLEQWDAWLTARQLDTASGALPDDARRIGFGIFYFEDDSKDGGVS
ncbi:MAG: DUF6502 family protein [Nitrospirota bacterium]